MICRKATVALPDANPYPSEHEIEFFVRFWVWNPHFRASEHKKGIFVRFEISMIQDLDPRDNSIAERVNGILLD